MSGLTFLSWVREGLAADGGAVDQLTGPLPGRSVVTLLPRVNDRAEVPVTAQVYGAGDVTGIDPAQVLRVSPAPGAADAEPSRFACVEFDQPDLPWAFTPAAADAQGRLRPWVVLVVVPAAGATVTGAPDGGLPRLRCDPAELPDLAESWAWAHAQVITDGDLADVDDLIAHAPDRTLSRLLCPRRLLPATRYLAAVVPAFEAGRLTGLGRELPAEDRDVLRPAWPPVRAESPWELPAYHHWSFATGVDGDFESLVHRLTPRALPAAVGTRPMDVGAAGEGMPVLPADSRVVGFPGALRPATGDAGHWDPQAEAKVGDALEEVLRGTGDDPADPPLTPPVHGAEAAVAPGTRGLPSAQDGPAWLRGLNRDPRHRAAAGLGAEVVRRHQEELVAAAWDQAAEVRRINEALRQGQLARSVADSLHRRLDALSGRMDSGPRADTARAGLLQLTQAALGSVPAAGGTAADAVAANREAEAALDPGFRKLLRPGGPLSAATGHGAGTTSAQLAAALSTRQATATPELGAAAGAAGLERLSHGALTFGELDSDVLTSKWWESDTGPRDRPQPVTPQINWIGAAMANRVFIVTTDGRVMSAVHNGSNAVSWVDHGTPPGTTATRAPAAIGNEHAVVLGLDRNLYRLYWDGDRWAWASHGKPSFANLLNYNGVVAVKRTSRPNSDDTATTGTFYSAYLISEAGTLVELVGSPGGLWGWADHGKPADGATLVGVPTVVKPWQVTVVSITGNVYTRTYKGGWSWQGYGQPSGIGFLPDEPTVPGPGLAGFLAKAGNGKLYSMGLSGGMFPRPTWNEFYDSTNGHTLGGVGNRAVVTSRASSVRCHDNGWWEPGGKAPVSRQDLWLVGCQVNGVVWVFADNKLLRLDTNASSPVWQDFGQPVLGGEGMTDALPAAHVRWRSQVGFRSALLVGTAESNGGAAAQVRVGQNTDWDGSVRGGWQRAALPVTPPLNSPQGFALCVADLAPPQTGVASVPDVVAFWIEASNTGGNLGKYCVGRNLSAAGTTGDWGPVQTLPTAMCTQYNPDGALSQYWGVQNATATLADLDGDGYQELIVAYVGGPTTARRLFLRIGWKLDPGTGAVQRGWGESVEVPWPGRPANGAPTITGIAVAVADLNVDLRPEIVIAIAEQTGTSTTVSYRIGWNVNGRGRCVLENRAADPWSAVRTVPGPFPTTTRGLGLAVADFTGTEKPDLLLLAVDATAGPTRATYRLGRDVVGDAPQSWSAPMVVDGAGAWGNPVAASLAVVDLPGSTLADKRAMITRFRAAATRHQGALLAAQARAVQADEEALGLRAIADAVRSGLDPETAVTGRVLGRVGGLDLGGAGLTDPLGPLLAPPSFAQPLAELLAELGQDQLLPGVGEVEPETLALLATNPAFVESFLVGANGELGRELVWRGFPTDRAATAFQHFWDARGTVEPGHEPADVPPVAQWPRTAALGTIAGGGGEQVVLLLRGELVRRFPTLGLHARRAVAPATPGGPRGLGAQRLEPLFSGTLGQDVKYVGFALGVRQALGDLDSGGTDPGWFFVFEENPTAPGFGLDVPQAAAKYGTAPATWRELSWASIAPDAGTLGALKHVRTTTPFGTPELPLRPARAPGEVVDKATWARNSAHMAHVTLQQPARVAFHATDLLPPEPAPTPRLGAAGAARATESTETHA
ncbi:hypothetical protein [Actinokineospora bangkokensis]|uniref:Uncharacterized protein n=1 Tax=Actinokineospora bangkokensis TaxID=1193682 RepID=A0A1Q9LLL3_9PSEU|nr:hypothetical protein [Actinokineospora bangkokensis]OLR92889.1 hypothetical protein BJP25_18095 [Actinokineospora bangkokensis]